jgi:hypothetical protein
MTILKNFDVPAKWSNQDGTLTERARGFLRSLFEYIGANVGTIPTESLGGDGVSTNTFLREDGQWANPTALSGGNPTAQVGLTAVNGSASTFIRSDGAPALSQAITPTWTGAHTFSVPITSASGGTGVNNGTSTLTYAANVVFSGAFTFTATLTGATGVTFPTSGTLATTAQLPVGANPTGTIGLAAVNGAAATFLRSDGAPALSQSIAPTWTGEHIFNSSFRLSAAIAPAQITSNQNDYNPTGLSTTSGMRINSDAARDITGLQGGSEGRVMRVTNIGAFAITLKHESASSTAANRFSVGADIVLGANVSALLWYDGTSLRWRAA